MHEIPFPDQPTPTTHYKDHTCTKYKKPRKNQVFVKQGIDPRYYIGECRMCGEKIIEKFFCLENAPFGAKHSKCSHDTMDLK